LFQNPVLRAISFNRSLLMYHIDRNHLFRVLAAQVTGKTETIESEERLWRVVNKT